MYISFQLHAFYHYPYDEYKAHRTVQAFEMSQFIKHTSETCDLVIAAGDLNTRPEELGLSVLTSNGNLDDAWTNQVVIACMCFLLHTHVILQL